ncbi:TetR/AcrR family transcriptional regulator [Methyloversatilis thermotolerans]|uniref:TetR/AcrR family transcriptional regulator n=1 Tax=Methyloversatilis thermotolerans TaxID=1346290 RepID=UPI0003672018|nr:TetR/AcrR family transcriptional regulator [Methyloversatilis thermotolerans]
MPAPHARAQTDRATWMRAASRTLAERGPEGIKVESLARELGLTKGSFYWHFKDRRALLDALLADWRDGRIADIRARTEGPPGEEAARLRGLVAAYGDSPNPRGLRVELAIRAWATQDAAAAAAVQQVDALRIECASRLFEAAGFASAEAADRSVLLYACLFGLGMMDTVQRLPRAEQTRQFIANLITAR